MQVLFGCLGYGKDEVTPLTRITCPTGLQLRVTLLGAKQTGKTKLLYELCNPQDSGEFPSKRDEPEEQTLTVETPFGPRIDFTMITTSNDTMDGLITSYTRESSVVVLMYSLRQLHHLTLLEQRYIPLLLKLTEYDSLTIAIVGTKTINNPCVKNEPLSFPHEVVRNMLLNWIVRTIRKQITSKIATYEITVDDYREVQKFKDSLLSFILTNVTIT